MSAFGRVHFFTKYAAVAISLSYNAWAIDVRSFGATGNGITDDTLAVQAAVNACSSGGTVTFSPGNYLVRGIALNPNCTYSGLGSSAVGSSTLTLSVQNGFILDVSQKSNIHITGLVLDSNGLGGGISAQLYASAQNIQIDHCEFRNVSVTANFPANLAIFSSWGIINATIQNNSFENVAGGIWLTALQNVAILNNTFVNVTQGDAIFVAPNPSLNGENLRIAENSGTNMARIAIELFQPDPNNGEYLVAPVVQNNSFSNWTGVGGMGMSIASGNGAIVSGNRLSNVTGPIQNAGMEVIVTGGQVTGNSIVGGFGEGITVVGEPKNTIANNRIVDATDNGIILACDNQANRCSSVNSTITGNVIVNAQNIGIKLDNDWSNSLIARNTITRTAGYWAADNTIMFAGIHQSPAPGPGVIDSNNIIQDATTWPYGFWFVGVRVNSPMPGSSITNNLVRSLTTVPFGTGILDNTGSATMGWIISGNTDIGMFQAMN